MKPHRYLPALVLGLLPFCPSTASASAVISTTEAFATSAWGVPAAPYRRDVWLGDALGVTNYDPFQMAEYYSSSEGGGHQWQWDLKAWEETTYLVFNPASFAGMSSVESAILTVTTTQRAGAPSGLTNGMTVTAHALLDDPTKILLTTANPDGNAYNPSHPDYNPGLDYNDNYGTFKMSNIGDIVASFVHGAEYGQYLLDLTGAVNAWLADPNAPGAFAIALTGRDEGNDPDAWLGIRPASHADAPFLTVTVPEPGSVLLVGAASVLFAFGRRRK